jgi:hypothetical protein
MTGAETRALESARLRLLTSLPRRHQAYFFAAVWQLCANRSGRGTQEGRNRDPTAEARELFSEIMMKLFGAVAGSEPDIGRQVDAELARGWTADEDPKRDARVAWLIDQVGGARGLMHRREDIRRWRHGGKWGERGYRLVQLEPEHLEVLSVEPDDPHHEDDIRRAWRGLLALAKSAFRPDEDASLLLDLMANDAEIRASFGAEWPIAALVAALNRSHPNPPWNDDRVENAKRRLKNWIARLRRDNGLDSIDLMDLFARYARKREGDPARMPAVGRPGGHVRTPQ